MQDLEKAKKQLHEQFLTLCVVKNGETMFKTASHGISGFLEAVEKLDNRLEDASVADKVVGKAIALVCVHAKVRAVYAVTLSKEAKAVLEQSAILHEWENLVENVLWTDGKKCPFETLVAETSNSEEAYRRLKALQKRLKECR